MYLGHEDSLTTQAKGIKDKLGTIENCEARVVSVFVLVVFQSFKVLGIFSWTYLTDLC